MNDFLLVLGIAALAAFLTYLGAPLAERFDVPHRVIGAALQFAAGVLAAIVALTLMPSAVQAGSPTLVVLAFFIGGALFVVVEYVSAQRKLANPAAAASGPQGLFFGIIVDMAIDGALIGVASTLDLRTGLLLALGVAVSTAPLAFVGIATAKQQGLPPERRRRLALMFVAAIVGGALLGFLVLRNQSIETTLLVIALASGFLITTITQSMIPEANREGEPSFAGLLFLGGLSLYALLSLAAV